MVKLNACTCAFAGNFFTCGSLSIKRHNIAHYAYTAFVQIFEVHNFHELPFSNTFVETIFADQENKLDTPIVGHTPRLDICMCKSTGAISQGTVVPVCRYCHGICILPIHLTTHDLICDHVRRYVSGSEIWATTVRVALFSFKACSSHHRV